MRRHSDEGNQPGEVHDAFFEAWLRCPMEKKWPLKRFPSRGPMHHWRTVGLDIPCQVARLQSLTPLLQAMVILP
jgi:hypothetical protein